MKNKARIYRIIFFILFCMIVFNNLFAVEFKVPEIAYDVTAADIDLDGDMDVIVGSRNNAAQDTISVFTNNGFGYFDITYLEREMAHYLKCRKINNDDLPDLVTKILEDYQIVYYQNEGNNNFGDAVPIHATLSNHQEYIRISDMNNDDSNDIIFYKRGSTDCYWGILENNGFGVFTDNLYYTANTPLSGLDVGLVNSDDLPDIIITTSAYGVFIFYNNYPYFDQIDFDADCYYSPYLFDMDNDGDNDIRLFTHNFFPSTTCNLKLFYNNSDGTFSQPDTLYFPEGTLINDINDYNNDNYPDITYFRYLWAGPDYSIYVCLNNTDGTFADPVEYYVGHPTFFSLISTDLDGNNYLDLIMTGYVGNDNLYRVKMLFNDGTGNFADDPQWGINKEVIKNDVNLLSNYPNPFNQNTVINYNLPIIVEDPIIEIYNIKGERIRELKIENVKCKINSVVWDGTDNYQNQVSSGVYLYRIKSDESVLGTNKMLLIK